MQFFYDEQYKNTIRITKALHDVLNKCTSSNETRYLINYAYLDKEKKSVFASDGRQIIQIDIPFELKEFETGYCMPSKIKCGYYLIPLKIDGKFPNTDRVIPNYPEDLIKLAGRLYPGKSDSVYHKNSIMLFKLQKETGCLLDHKYLEVLKMLDEFHVRSEGEEKSVEFIGYNWKYVLMPMSKTALEDYK